MAILLSNALAQPLNFFLIKRDPLTPDMLNYLGVADVTENGQVNRIRQE